MAITIDLYGKTAVITGGTRGIGAAIADLFAEAGANLIITGTQDESLNRRVEDLKIKAKGEVQGWVADFSDASSTEAICKRISELSQLEILVNNAGINHIKPVGDIKKEDMARLLAINLQTPTLLIGAATIPMVRQKQGKIVNIGSIWSVITKPGRAMYTASKFGIVGLTKSSAADLGRYNILVNALSPGFTRTDLTNATVPLEEQEKIARQIPLLRLAEPEEMARIALFLCSDLNTYITGQNIVVDGGFVSV